MPKKKWTDKETFYVLIAIGFTLWICYERMGGQKGIDPCGSDPSHVGCYQIPSPTPASVF